ncbi:MAG: hypothetical protein RRB13_07790 [bacterium]|nr:hypothetical protein [bacterium]
MQPKHRLVLRQLVWLVLILVFQRAELWAKAQADGSQLVVSKVQTLQLDTQQARQLRMDLEAQGAQVIEGPQAQALYDRQLYAQAGQWDNGYPPEREQKREAQARSSSGNGFPAPNLGSGGGDGAAVLFVIIGLVVVFAFVFYAAYYLGRQVVYGNQSRGWVELGLGGWAFGNSTESGNMTALRLGLGQEIRSNGWGLAAEIGQIDATLDLDPEESTGGQIDLKGAYAIVGPRITFGHRGNSLWLMELMAGTSEHQEVEVVAKALIGYRFQPPRGLYFGFSLGSLMVSLKKDLGLVRQQNPYNLLGGLETGVHF